MARTDKDTTARKLLAAYDALVEKTAEDAAEASRLRDAYQLRTGVFGPEDPWFETRSRAQWDDILSSPGFQYERAHRGFFVVADTEVVAAVVVVDLVAARDRGMETTAALDALMRMDLVFRSSSRVKASFAYKAEGLSRPR